jgi:hypothetical protein
MGTLMLLAFWSHILYRKHGINVLIVLCFACAAATEHVIMVHLQPGRPNPVAMISNQTEARQTAEPVFNIASLATCDNDHSIPWIFTEYTKSNQQFFRGSRQLCERLVDHKRAIVVQNL